MFAGLDFGTSNCSIGVMKEQQPKLVPLDNGKNRMPSALFVQNEIMPPAQLLDSEIAARVAQIKQIQLKNGSITNHEAIISSARHQLRKEHRQTSSISQTVNNMAEALRLGGEIIFGEEAELSHIAVPESGFYIKSPKSFLGADINATQRAVFTIIVEKMLAFIKGEVEFIEQNELADIVIGRPVNFHGLLGQDGNQQALDIIGNAAANVGFKQVEFLMEPVAAAYDYERQLSEDKVVLVLDLGGGTTDCSMIKLGPGYRHIQDRESCILSHTGQRIGGIDLDNKLALMSLMPHFGKNAMLSNGLPVPNNLFRQAVSVNDVAAQKDFNLPRTGKELTEYCRLSKDKNLRRLKTLRDEKLGLRVSRSAELAKILLSDKTSIDLSLDYIENDLHIPVQRTDLSDAIADELNKFEHLLKEAINLAGTEPDVLYVTGGTAMSPVIQNWIKSIFPNFEIVIGDHFGSVTSGLVTQAERLFRV
ncbi:molecular chaperone [Glaciecola sp. MF2-115]|uniref:molecular chaperone n=1 Tax=Glaciecola sp. MF2-115 TaxID=3384827 RepID=UPI00399F20D1